MICSESPAPACSKRVELAPAFRARVNSALRLIPNLDLASWAGLTPTHRESDTTVHRGRITKQGSRLVRWAAVEAVQRLPGHTRLGGFRDQVGARRGRNIGVVTAARQLVELVFYGLRDGHIRPCPRRRALPRREPGSSRGGCRSCWP